MTPQEQDQLRRRQQRWITHSPWGTPDHVLPVAEGIAFVTTPSHGGYRLSSERLAAMPEHLRIDRLNTGWFEEDCDAAMVAVTFPKYFSAIQVQAAWDSLKRWHKEVVAEVLAN